MGGRCAREMDGKEREGDNKRIEGRGVERGAEQCGKRCQVVEKVDDAREGRG